MMTVPHTPARALVGVAAVYATTFGAEAIWTGAAVLTNSVALAAFLAALAVGLTGPLAAPLSPPRTLTVTAAALLLPVIGTVGRDPAQTGLSSFPWYVGGVSCLVLVLLWRRRVAFGGAALGALVVHTVLVSGVAGLLSNRVAAASLILAVLGAGGWVVRRTSHDLERHAAVSRVVLEWEAAQDAYETVRQLRLRETARMGAPMLRRIVAADGRLDAAERHEARVLEQTIRDEIRGRRLLNDAVREQVLRLRRAGAAVQVNDDGGLDDVGVADHAALLDRVAEALAGVTSDRVIIRTAPKESRVALTVVAMSVDPVAAALGMDDEDEQVDLWLELERPSAVLST